METTTEWLEEIERKTGWRPRFDLGELCIESEEILKQPNVEDCRGVRLETARSLGSSLKMRTCAKYGPYVSSNYYLGFLYHDVPRTPYRSKFTRTRIVAG